MTIAERLKNLWRLSEYEFDLPFSTSKTFAEDVKRDISMPELMPKQMGYVVKRKPKDPIDEIVGEIKDII